jgi:hypothetical protein
MAVDSNKKWHEDYARRASLLGNVGQLDLGPMGPDGLRLLLTAAAGHSGVQRASSSNSGKFRNLPRLIPEGWNKVWALAFSGETSRGPLVTGVLYAKCIAVWPR